MTRLRFILGDQLSLSISSLDGADPENDIIFMCEVIDEATYVKHHKKKIAFIFSAMRHFAKSLRSQGFTVDYVTLDDAKNTGSFLSECQRAVTTHTISELIITEPGEYRVFKLLEELTTWDTCTIEIRPDTRFMCSINDFKAWAANRSSLIMEYFYREMRKKYQILMDGDSPEGGKWNYDKENRKIPKKSLSIPAPYHHPPDDITIEVIQLVQDRFSDHFGDIRPFHLAVTREQACDALALFIEERLPFFGDYQDAMIEGEPWMYHAHIGAYLNCGLLLPKECIDAAEASYHHGHAPLNAVEGFIRQIMGWREYVRGIYWLKMPGYASENFFEAKRPLPDFFWTADTSMNCLKQCVKETKAHAYAHHIQRLMILGNFALLSGIDPKWVNDWFLVVYADAYEWVELPNVTGMTLFADGGILASKPYAAGGSYINKMSDYCKNCRYSVSKKHGDDACPFNYLYWDFLARNRHVLEKNHRVGMMYNTYDRFSEEKKVMITKDSHSFLASI